MLHRLSIVVASLNALHWLNRLHADVMACDPSLVELVIADGGSEDGTVAWLNSLSNQGNGPRVVWLSAPDTGVAQAWNRGLALVTGRWVLFLGADDRVPAPEAVRTLLGTTTLIAATTDLVALPVMIVSPQGRRVTEARPRPGPGNRLVFSLNTVPHQGLLHRADLWSRFGGFDESFRITADYEFLVRALLAGASLEVLDHPAVTHMTFGGISKHDPLATIREIRRAQRKNGLRRPTAAWCRAWLRAVARTAVLPVLGMKSTAWLADLLRRLRGLEPVWTIP